jgi:C_GCAxxG_C_C family probable redox protein
MSKVQQAVNLFEQGYNCSQAVLAAYGPALGMEKETCLKVASGFGGGMGRSGGVCGAITGVFMVIGLKYGSASAEDKDAKLQTYQLVANALESFRNRTGSVNCRDLLGFDLGTPEGQTRAKQPGSFDICAGIVRSAAEIVEKIM